MLLILILILISISGSKQIESVIKIKVKVTTKIYTKHNLVLFMLITLGGKCVSARKSNRF